MPGPRSPRQIALEPDTRAALAHLARSPSPPNLHRRLSHAPIPLLVRMDIVSHATLDWRHLSGGTIRSRANITLLKYYELFGGLLFTICGECVGGEFSFEIRSGSYVSFMVALVRILSPPVVQL